jgi:vancomycin resistance protein VanK
MNQSFTYHINTLLSEEEMLSALSVNWRHNLKRSLKQNLIFKCSDSSEDIYEFYKIYLDMAKINRMRIHYSKQDLIAIKKNLAPFGKLYLFLAQLENRIISGRVICVIGNRAYDILAAATREGRKRYSSYLLIWEIFKWCKNINIEYFDISGIDPYSHKGIYNFKKGMGGNFVEYVGEWELFNNWLLGIMVNFYIFKSHRD